VIETNSKGYAMAAMTIKEFLAKCKENDGWVVADHDRRVSFSVTIPSGKRIMKTPDSNWVATYMLSFKTAKEAYEYLDREHSYALRLAGYKVMIEARMPEFEALEMYADDEYLGVEQGRDSFIFSMKKAKIEAQRGDHAVAFANELIALCKKYKVYFG
jgi:hypothetical protein